MSPDCPKLSMPSGTTRWPRTPPSQLSASGWPSRTVMMRASRDNGVSNRATGALGLLHVVEAKAQQHGKLVDEGGLVGQQAGLADADQRRMDALMRAAFGRQGHARRRGDDHESRILVAGIIQRIEAAGDEGIVERADRQQARAEDLVTQAERGELDEQVVLGDAELD